MEGGCTAGGESAGADATGSVTLDGAAETGAGATAEAAGAEDVGADNPSALASVAVAHVPAARKTLSSAAEKSLFRLSGNRFRENARDMPSPKPLARSVPARSSSITNSVPSAQTTPQPLRFLPAAFAGGNTR